MGSSNLINTSFLAFFSQINDSKLLFRQNLYPDGFFLNYLSQTKDLSQSAIPEALAVLRKFEETTYQHPFE